MKKLLITALALPAVVALMLLAFLAPTINSGPDDLPLAVAGPQPAVSRVTGMLEQKSPGAFEVTTYDSPQAATEAVRERDAIGALNLGADGVEVIVASGAGTPYKNVLTGMAEGLKATGQTVTMTDVAPLPEADPAGSALAMLGLPVAFGGIASALAVSRLMNRRLLQLAGVLATAVVAGLAVAAIIQFGYNAVEANYWAFAGVLTLGIAATSLFVLALESLWGLKGIALGAIVTMFVSNPLSGLATGWQWLPKPWGAMGQFLPLGAAGDAARSVAYFDGAGAAGSVWILLGWILVAVCGVLPLAHFIGVQRASAQPGDAAAD
ncbi:MULTISPECIES: ABC transporter permease [Corynebacterium]|uniref:ABC transporter permease n=1 Tax=Corynebacterium TaxID=1716 RepID=UPI001E3BD1BB|nr:MULTISPECIES: ABC transporter permease [Corynebacterium]